MHDHNHNHDEHGCCSHSHASTSVAQPAKPFDINYVKTKKIGRNDPCSCGSGKKYKKCCLL